MNRAALLIGVKKTGNLPELQAVTSSVNAMALWAKSQGIEQKLIRVLTDEDGNGHVTVYQIKDEIRKLVDLTTIDQLIVYFSGHGFNIESEFWLLSDAPSDVDAAVNVDGSVRLARYCGIPHVLIISDCCRSAAEGLQAMQVRGSNIFPNNPASGTSRPVDLLYACARGRPSLEIANPVAAVQEAVDHYSALYSEVLLEYLNGKHDEALEPTAENGQSFGLVRLGALADALKIEVPKRLKAKLNVDPKITQLPDDIISRSTANSWISRIPLSVTRSQAPITPVSRSRPITPFTVSMKLVSESLAGDLGMWNDLLTRSLGADAAALQRFVAAQVVSFGPEHFETRCGIKIRGARVVRTIQRSIGAEFLGTEGNIVRLHGVPQGGALVLLVVENGSGAVVPALPEFLTALTFEDGQLVDVSYEPSGNSSRAGEYRSRAQELRSLRSSVSASAAFGFFRLDEQDGLSLAKRMQYSKGVDPSLALYAAYAYDTLQRQDLINQMRRYMEDDVGLTFFDIALLSSKEGLGAGRVVPPFPMLSQGWALLSACRAELPVPLKGIEMRRVPSLWTLFNPAGVALVERAILAGEIQ